MTSPDRSPSVWTSGPGGCSCRPRRRCRESGRFRTAGTLRRAPSARTRSGRIVDGWTHVDKSVVCPHPDHPLRLTLSEINPGGCQSDHSEDLFPSPDGLRVVEESSRSRRRGHHRGEALGLLNTVRISHGPEFYARSCSSTYAFGRCADLGSLSSGLVSTPSVRTLVSHRPGGVIPDSRRQVCSDSTTAAAQPVSGTGQLLIVDWQDHSAEAGIV